MERIFLWFWGVFVCVLFLDFWLELQLLTGRHHKMWLSLSCQPGNPVLPSAAPCS